jgi:hypothetical protein
MGERTGVAAIDRAKPRVSAFVVDARRRLLDGAYRDVRLEASEAKGGYAQNGAARETGAEAESATGLHVLAGQGMTASGCCGRLLGHADGGRIDLALAEGIEPVDQWALANAALVADPRHAAVPLIWMTDTVLAHGERDPQALIAEVGDGHDPAGPRLPSLSASRETFRLSARNVHQSAHGKLTTRYRHGGLSADSRDCLMSIDASGDDRQLMPGPDGGQGRLPEIMAIHARSSPRSWGAEDTMRAPELAVYRLSVKNIAEDMG